MRRLTIAGKEVFVSDPYDADLPNLEERDGELEKILSAWMANLPLHPLLLGEPGVGKNHIVYEAARLTGKRLYVLQGHEDIRGEDLICTVRLSDDPDRKVDYVASPLLTAVATGGICFIDEIGKIRPEALAPLIPLLDDRRYVDSTLLAGRETAQDGFRFVATSNEADFEARTLPDWLRDRLGPIVTVSLLNRAVIDKLLESRYPRLHDGREDLLNKFWEMWRSHEQDKSPRPRTALKVFAYAIGLADEVKINPKTGEDSSVQLEGTKASVSITVEHIERAFTHFFDIKRS